MQNIVIKPLYNTSTIESFKHLRSLRLLNLNSGKTYFSMDMQRHLNMNSRHYNISFFVLLWCRPQEHDCVPHYKTKAPLSIKNSNSKGWKEGHLEVIYTLQSMVFHKSQNSLVHTFWDNFPNTFVPIQSCSFQ